MYCLECVHTEKYFLKQKQKQECLLIKGIFVLVVILFEMFDKFQK